MSTEATRTMVMTGASRGIGAVAAAALLRSNPDLHLVVLARSGGDAAAAQLRGASNNANVSAVSADLASMGSIRAAAAAVRADLERHVLPPLAGFVGNAGTQLLRANDASADGIEMTFAVNVLANHVLIDELRHYFLADARIVLTSSDTHFGDFRHNQGLVPAPLWREPSALATPGTADRSSGVVAGRTAYSTSKLAVVYLVHALARRLPPGIEVFSFNPGLVPGTGLVRDSGAVSRFLFRRVMPVLTLTRYARTQKVSGFDLAAAAGGAVRADTGSYVNGSTVERSSPESYDLAREDALWDELTRLSHPHAVSPS